MDHDENAISPDSADHPSASQSSSAHSKTIGAELYVELDGILINRSLLGQHLKVNRDTFRYQIEIPKELDSFKFPRVGGPLGPADERDYEPTSCFVGQDSQDFVELRIVRVLINVERVVPAEEYDSKNPEHEKWHDTTLREVWNSALAAVTDFTDLVRLRGQPSIEPTGRYPRVLNLVTLFTVNEEGGASYGPSIGEGGKIHILSEENVLSEARFRELERDLTNQRNAWVGELLVGEALYLAQSAQKSGPAQATLIAAMGVEVHTKDVLRRLAGVERAPLLALLLENPRDWSTAAYSLFSKALPTICDRDLGADHKQLSKRVQKLFEARNGVAHRGEGIAPANAKVHVETARDAVAYLRSILS